jgi:hypothetical protein
MAIKSGRALKSGVKTSTVVLGHKSLIALTVFANWFAPWSGKSSLATEVMTAWRKLSLRTIVATFKGSYGSTGSPRPVLTAQNPHLLVQVSPRSMKVAVPREKHSPMLGQRALWQTVLMPNRLSSCLSGSANLRFGTFERIQLGIWCAAKGIAATSA